MNDIYICSPQTLGRITKGSTGQVLVPRKL